jgi:hypothetical protein
MEDKAYAPVQIRRDTHKRLKIIAALEGKTLIDVIDELVAKHAPDLPWENQAEQGDIPPLHGDAAHTNARVRARVMRQR